MANFNILLWGFALLSIATSLSVIRAVENSANCGPNLYNCGDGNCITLDKICDGIPDCTDGNDETHAICRRNSPPSSSACIFPPYPDHGTYTVEDDSTGRPGETREFFKLTVSCRPGYGLESNTGNHTQQVSCVKGKWTQKMPKCVRFCRLDDPDPSVRYMCHIAGKGVEVCKNYVPPGTIVDPICNSPIYHSTEVLPNMKCKSGFWNYIALCKAECGRINLEANQLGVDSNQVKRGELPWYVGIYRQTANAYLQICGGSLVTNNLIISAARCFWAPTKKVIPSSEFRVAAGKLYRSWDSKEDVDAQKSAVKEIKIPSVFAGEATSYQDDIAVLILTNPFMYTTYIRPVCLDFGAQFEMSQLQHGKLGKVAGWGPTSAKSKASETLMMVDIKYKEYTTGDKFYAGNTNGVGLCHRDSGAGLAFSDVERGVERYYLRGITSIVPKSDDQLCNENTYTEFTTVSKHEDLIKRALTASEKKKCSSCSFQCADGSCVELGSDCNRKQDCAESDEFCPTGAPPEREIIQNLKDCGVFAGGIDMTLANRYQFTKGHMPWLTAVYTKANKAIRFISGGTLISNRHVITVAHLLPETRNIVVKLGTDNLSDESNVTIIRNAISKSIIESFDSETLIDDIAIVKLDSKVNFNEYIKPACLWNGNTNLNSIVESSGMFSGWGEDVPHLAEMPIVSLNTCQTSNRPYEFLTLHKILCAGDRDSFMSNVTVSYPGGGLYLFSDGKWMLRGILMVPLQYNIPQTNRPHTHVDYAVFIDAAQYLPWIGKVLELN